MPCTFGDFESDRKKYLAALCDSQELGRLFGDHEINRMAFACERTMQQVCSDYGTLYSPMNYVQICRNLGEGANKTKMSAQAGIHAMMFRAGVLLLPKLEPIATEVVSPQAN